MFKRKTTFYVRLILFILILSTLPVLLVGTFSYIKASDAIHEQVSEDKRSSVYQTQTNIEHILKTADHSLTYFVNSSLLRDTLNQPLTATQFQLYNDIRKELTHLQTYEIGIEDIVLLSTNQEWLMNNWGLQRITKKEIEDHFQRYFELPVNSTWIYEVDTWGSEFNEELANSCSTQMNLVKKLPLNSNQKTGLAIASIPACSVNKILSENSQNEAFFVLDEQYRPVGYHNLSILEDDLLSDGTLIEALAAQQTANGNGQFSLPLSHSTYTVTFRTSDYNQWTYVSVISSRELAKQSNAIGAFTMYISAGVLLLSLLYSWVGSRRIYRPVQELYQMITATFSAGSAKKPPKDEFELIHAHIHNVLDLNNELEEKLQGQIKQLKQFFVLNLIKGHMSPSEIETKYETFQYPKDWGQLHVLTLQIDSLEGTKYAKEEKDVLLFSINNLVETLIPEVERLTPALLNNTVVLILLTNVDHEQKRDGFVREKAEAIMNEVRQQLDISVSIGVSLPYDDITKTQEAYDEGIEALKYRIKLGCQSVIFFSNLAHTHSFHTYYPKQQENELFDALKLGDKSNVKDHLDALIDGIFQKDLHPSQYQISLLRLLNNTIQLLQTLGIDSVDVYDKKTLFDQLFSLQTIDEVKQWFFTKLIAPSVHTVAERMDSQYKTISDQIIHIIQNEFDMELTLESIAERLHYNPNYLSSIFRKETNISFSEYLSSYRLAMAKKWLLETSMPIREIAERLCYGNSQNFIRSFKKKEGMTPGKYRQSKVS
ncbi:helix-turn-helix domain-containing protein [Halalkalibacterium halodurans]|uniref:cache domain-containing protein n=1 Tax=Halalkalibacterium halodurans TaxID=86665 RepID=UPI002E248036|nr:helix-turn-helix domain-containing protein [Halalkalibacterium halodurans]